MDLNGLQIDPVQMLKLLDAADAEEDLYTFLKMAWPHFDPAPWSDGWPIEAIAEHLTAVCDGQIKRLLINIPPRCSKSSLVSVAFPAWVWAQRRKSYTSGPGVKFLCASHALDLAQRDSAKCRDLIKSAWYQSLWGDRFQIKKDNDSKSRYANDQGGERLIRSITAGATGEGGDCLSGDTLVSTPDGQIPIKDIRPGVCVHAVDVARGTVVEKMVLAFRRIPSRVLCEVHTSAGHSIRCTPDHLIYVPGEGYRAASSLGKGDRIAFLRTGRDEFTAKHHAHEVQPMRQARGSHAVRDTEASEEGVWADAVLLSGLPIGAQLHVQSTPMSYVRGENAVTRKPRMFGRMLAQKALREAQEACLRTMRNGIRWLDEILLSIMRRCAAFGEYAGFEKLQLFPHGALQQPVQRNQTSHYGEGWNGLYGVRRSSGHENGIEWQSARQHDGPSYGREHTQQRAGKSDFSVYELPQETPSWDIGYVTSVSRDCEQEECVYDIQVEGCHNFFANGVLVHNCILIDDPNDAGDERSEVTRESVIDWWSGTMSSRLNNREHGAFIIIQQRIAEDDLSGHILEKNADGWDHLMLPMRYEPDRSFKTSIGWEDPRKKEGDLLWPERFSIKSVLDQEREWGPWRTAGQFQQRPEPAGGGIIKREWWQPWESSEYPPMDYILASVDTAYTEKTGNDPSAMTVWGVFSEDTNGVVNRMLDAEGRPMYADRTTYNHAPKLMLMHAWTERLEFHDLVNKVAATAKRLKVDKLLIEAKASGISVAQEIRRLYAHEGFGVQLINPGALDKTARLYSVQHIFADLIVHAPDKEWAETVFKQVGQFPKGRHDDLVDCTSMAIRHLRDIGMLTRAPERESDLAESLRFKGNDSKQPLYPT